MKRNPSAFERLFNEVNYLSVDEQLLFAQRLIEQARRRVSTPMTANDLLNSNLIGMWMLRIMLFLLVNLESRLKSTGIRCDLNRLGELMACFVGLKPCLSSWKSAGSRLAHQPEGLPCIEQAALAQRLAPDDHEELMRRGMSLLINTLVVE